MRSSRLGLPSGRRRERRQAPWRGYKLAFPMVSADGSRAGFTGVVMGRQQPYGLSAEAVCALGVQHRCPSRWCDCGFYCFHRCEDARALTCDPQYAGTVLLEVQASGRYIRYEKGLRYAHQRVTEVAVGRCGCGWGAEVLAVTGAGVVGWGQLMPMCRACLQSRPALTLAEFAALLGEIPVRTEGPAIRPAAPDAAAEDQLLPLLSAEIAVLHARLDELQSQLDRFTKDR